MSSAPTRPASPVLTFDHTAPELMGPPFWDAVADLQRVGPLVWVETGGGFWAATSQETILAIAQDWQRFSSAEGVGLQRATFEQMPRIVPLETDPPDQRAYRKQVNPHLAVKALAGLDGPIRAIADELIDAFVERGSCDIAVEFARRFPGTVFFRLIVHSTDEAFVRAERSAHVISFENEDQGKLIEAVGQLKSWAADEFAAREARPGSGDIVEAIMQLGRADGVDDGMFTDSDRLSGLQILVQGGIGTSASVIGSAMLALARDQELQQRVRADPSLVPGFLEEVVRTQSPLPIVFRTATEDVEVAGQRIAKGDKVCLIFGAAGRDPEVFDRPGEIELDRPHCRHLSFGAGVHRCIGSNLARLQMRIALEQLLARLGPFSVPDGAEVTYDGRMARGPASIPLRFSPAG
ncbi:cytochrome P450 [Trujillonella endophytica]|uniref:Cytochrome P450 n=1 Tax=Trujillonella endophytica TaxID=673521 RepID=A0A1H8WHV2_9ACTN|nr:cytochrome P450 [Trujillella endophytica]SEP26678.1 Cytochrome P450 [Trujillella endophytica]